MSAEEDDEAKKKRIPIKSSAKEDESLVSLAILLTWLYRFAKIFQKVFDWPTKSVELRACVRARESFERTKLDITLLQSSMRTDDKMCQNENVPFQKHFRKYFIIHISENQMPLRMMRISI